MADGDALLLDRAGSGRVALEQRLESLSLDRGDAQGRQLGTGRECGDDSPASLFAKMLDIEMLALTPRGKERTAVEWQALFAAAGLRVERIVNTDSPAKVIEGRAI